MKLRTLVLTSLLLASSMLTACNNSSGTSSGSDTSGGIPEGYVRVYYYVDFNQPDSGEHYYVEDFLPNSKITKPANPTAPDPAFPTFLGWSYKEVIDNKNDLWNFESDTLTMPYGGNIFNIYGIWAAEGEA